MSVPRVALATAVRAMLVARPVMSAATRTLSLLDAALAPIDRARGRVLRFVSPFARRFVVDRATRTTALALGGIATLFLLTAVAPVWLLVLGPVTWGAVHLLADVRYLVVRPGLHRRRGYLLVLALTVSLAVFAGYGMRAGFAGAMVALATSHLAWRRKALGLTVLGAFLAWALAQPRGFDVVSAHVHNLVAVGVWWAWRPRNARGHTWAVGLFVLAMAAILAGALDPVVAFTGAWSSPALRHPLGTLLLAVAPYPEHLVFARRLLLSFAFAQAVHYLVWARLVPEDARHGGTPRSFRQSLRALVPDVGVGGVLLTLGVTVGLLVWATLDVVGARTAYLRLALFHGHLELTALAVLWGERTRPW